MGIQAGGQVVMPNTYPPPIRIHVLKMFVLFEKGLKVFISVYFGFNEDTTKSKKVRWS